MEYIKIKLHGKYGNGLYTTVDGDFDGEYFSQFKWYVSLDGYVYRYIVGSSATSATRFSYLHREVCSPPKGLVTDHINGNRLDNRSCNLRWATRKQNTYNRKSPLRKKCNLPIGVNKKNNRYIVYIQKEYIGCFMSIGDASEAYEKEARKRYGKFYRNKCVIKNQALTAKA